MNFKERVEQAFGLLPPPGKVIEHDHHTTEQQDALWFARRDWRHLSRDDWEAHRDAVYAFTPAAFQYFLPSILVLSLEAPDQWFWPADSLLQMLDRSPTPEYWDDFLMARLGALPIAVYDVLAEWLLALSEAGEAAMQASLGRAFDTIELLREHALARHPD